MCHPIHEIQGFGIWDFLCLGFGIWDLGLGLGLLSLGGKYINSAKIFYKKIFFKNKISSIKNRK